MHPLNTFPVLLDYVRLSPFILRVVVGLFILSLGRERQKKSFAPSAFIYYVSGLLLILGLYAQIASILGVVVLKIDFYFDYWKNRKSVPVPKYFYFLYAIAGLVLISLLFTGAGFMAFDMPF